MSLTSSMASTSPPATSCTRLGRSTNRCCVRCGIRASFIPPRAVVRLMVAVTDPRLGETVLDPACGHGGFLVEAYNHLSKQVKTVADRKTLQERTLRGCEPKSLPYLLCQMNLLLHGLDAPQIEADNALRHKLTE